METTRLKFFKMTLSVLPETGINLLISNGISSVHLIIGFNVKFLSDFIQSLLYLKLTYRLYMYMLKFFKIFWQFFIKAAPKVIPKIGLIKVLKIDFLEWQPCFWIFQRLSIENKRRFVWRHLQYIDVVTIQIGKLISLKFLPSCPHRPYFF